MKTTLVITRVAATIQSVGNANTVVWKLVDREHFM